MATPLDIGLLKHIGGGLFPFLLVLVLGYAVLVKIPFKDKPGIAAIIAFLLAIATVLSDVATKTINAMAPWFVLLMIFMILLLMAFMTLGVKEDTITGIITSKEHGSTITNWVVAIMLIIGIGSLMAVINEEKPVASLQAGGNTTAIAEDSSGGFWQTLFHPKVLGMALVLLVSYFTINYLTKKAT